MITKIEITKLVNKPEFDHREFIKWLFANIGDGIAVGSIYDFTKSTNKLWCWESSWSSSYSSKHKYEFLHIRGTENAKLFNLVWM